MMALCALDGCDERAAKRSRYCSLACAEKEIAGLRKRIRETRSRFSAADIKASGYSGEASPVALRGLRNPFGERSAAHVVFEILRSAGLGDGINRDRERLIDRLVDLCTRKNVRLHSPRERVRGVVRVIRSKGFELLKDDAGRFRLTGRRVY